jgi:hypothetical protein
MFAIYGFISLFKVLKNDSSHALTDRRAKLHQMVPKRGSDIRPEIIRAR